MTKFILLTFATVIFLCNGSFAARKIEGYYIAENSTEKIKVIFLVPVNFLATKPNYEKMQTEVTYLIDDREHFLSPQKILEVSFIFNDKPILMRSVFNHLRGHKLMFLNVVEDGLVSYYTYYESSYSPGSFNASTGAMSGSGMQNTELNLLQRDNGELVRIRGWFFKKDLFEFFVDCPALVKLIKVGQLTELSAIVKWYNYGCL